MAEAYFLGIDQGTTSCRSIVFSNTGRVLGVGQKEFTQHFPHPGWVEHDAQEIWECQLATMREALATAGLEASAIQAVGITNQRETVVAWDGHSGIPLEKAIVWQDRRTADLCHTLREEGLEPYIREKTGLVADAYFSGTKIHWLIHHSDRVRDAARSGRLRLGTIDSWLVWCMTAGAFHVTDVSNASRTLLFDINRLQWDPLLMQRMAVQPQWLPRVVPSSGFVGMLHADFLGKPIPITGLAGDQQAALYGHGAWEPGQAKNTFGTGCFLLMNTGTRPVPSRHGLLTTIAWQKGGVTNYALEGSVFIAGAALQWLRDGLQILDHASQSEALASSLKDNDGVYFVPAFVGMGAPYWDMEARGLITGITRGTTRAHLVRAALESMAYQTWEVLECMCKDRDAPLTAISVDGGATANNFLMQFLADILRIPVKRPLMQEMTAWGAVCLAAEAIGHSISTNSDGESIFEPRLDLRKAERLKTEWKQAVSRALSRK
ncbi:MAG: glycerol kinase GlpK [Flavobacteriales bacterium]|nr:glycerol kinase GlpK [Flavobacteriales bacterium]MCX7768673.1 glycerol kinase GlpK [Flavobacteriales bacterium]MDW8410686.1 glycerol kinase GlpK [Flavobacteriales bacterium]